MTDQTTAAPCASVKRRTRRTGAALDRALGIVRGRTHIAPECLRYLSPTPPKETADERLTRIEKSCAAQLVAARAVRDFAREVADLDEPSREMLRAGIEAAMRAR